MVVTRCVICGATRRLFPSQILYGEGKYCSRACRNKARTRPLQERFWEKVQKTDGCWIWIAARLPQGYGIFCLKKGGRPFRAHRLAYEFTYGPFNPELWVLHRCDNPPCVRPDHLFLGTAQDNYADANAKGRLRTDSLLDRGCPVKKVGARWRPLPSV